MTTEEKYELLVKFLKECCFSIDLNMNDTFGYACAEAYSMEISDLDFVLWIYKNWGLDGLDAYVAVKTKQDVLKSLKTNEYLEAKRMLDAHLSQCHQCHKKMNPVSDSGLHFHLMNGDSLISGEGFKYLCVDCSIKVERSKRAES